MFIVKKHTGFGRKKPEKRFHKMKKKKDRAAAISRLGRNDTSIIPRSVKYMKPRKTKEMNHTNLTSVHWNPIIEYTINVKRITWRMT